MSRWWRGASRWLLNPLVQVAVILGVAAFFRLWAIDSLPPGLFGDEAAEGLDALDVLAGRGQIFFPTNYGREGLYIWLVAASIKLFGITPLATRLPAIALGILTCGLAWWMARELVAALAPRPGSTPHPSRALLNWLTAWAPLIVGLYLATAYWHVHFSRFSQRTILTPFAIALATAAFWRAVNYGRLRWWVAAGAGIGLALHSYSVGRFFPLFIALFLVAQWVVERPAADGRESRILGHHWRGILVMIGVAALFFAPLGWYFIAHPGSFFQRASAVATYAGGSGWTTLTTIGRAALANLGQYVIPGGGDMAQFHNLPGRPIFELLTAVLALLGLLTCLRTWRRPVALFLLLWLGVMTAPAALATDRFPTLPRVLGVLPGLYAFPALGLAVLLAAVQRIRRVQLRRIVPGALVVLALAAPAAITYRDYFMRWGPAAATFDAFEGDMVAAWRWMVTTQPTGHVYLSSDIYRHPTYMFLGEQVTVTEYFTHYNPDLSWFDARASQPLPAADEDATYLIGASASLTGPGATALAHARLVEAWPAPDGRPALTVLQMRGSDSVLPEPRMAPVPFGEQLGLTAAFLAQDQLTLTWETRGPEAADPGGYRLEVVAGEHSATLPLDAFRGPEWTPGGRFLTWHVVHLGGRPVEVRLRVVRVEDGRSLGDWQTVAVGAD